MTNMSWLYQLYWLIHLFIGSYRCQWHFFLFIRSSTTNIQLIYICPYDAHWPIFWSFLQGKAANAKSSTDYRKMKPKENMRGLGLKVIHGLVFYFVSLPFLLMENWVSLLTGLSEKNIQMKSSTEFHGCFLTKNNKLVIFPKGKVTEISVECG